MPAAPASTSADALAVVPKNSRLVNWRRVLRIVMSSSLWPAKAGPSTDGGCALLIFVGADDSGFGSVVERGRPAQDAAGCAFLISARIASTPSRATSNGERSHSTGLGAS